MKTLEQISAEYKQYPELNRLYRHYKGGVYEVMHLATHSETDEVMVVYKSKLFGSYHVRPLSMWFDIIHEDEYVIDKDNKRFTSLGCKTNSIHFASIVMIITLR